MIEEIVIFSCNKQSRKILCFELNIVKGVLNFASIHINMDKVGHEVFHLVPGVIAG